MQLINEIDRQFNTIFKGYDINKLDSYTKRKMIYKFLCKNLSYDWNCYYHILKKDVKRNICRELSDTILFNKGVCNSISQYYKILLAKAGVQSSVVITHKHAVNYVYNSLTNTYSIDDVTMGVIFNNSSLFFDYDIKRANLFGQLKRPTLPGMMLVVSSGSFINKLLNEEVVSSESYDLSVDSGDFLNPNKVISLKKRYGRK